MAVWRPVDFSNVSVPEDDQQASSSHQLIVLTSSDDEDDDDNIPAKKRRGSSLSVDAKNLILSCYDTLVSEAHKAPVIRTAELLKISHNTVKFVLKKRHQAPTVLARKSFTRINEYMKEAIVSKIYESYARNLVPTATSILEELAEDGITIPYKMTQFRKLLESMDFTFRKLNRRQYIMESERIIKLRITYLNKIVEFRRLNRYIIWLDETWFDTHDVKTKGLSDSSSKCVLKAQPSRGSRVIILHVGGENGWINNGLLISAKAIKDCNADYHEDMSGALFEKWFQEQLLPNIPTDTVIVMDNAPSHSRLLEKIPNTSFRKAEIIEFLTKQNITISPEIKTKSQLLELVKSYNFDKKYIIDEMARSSGCEVLRLPPYFCIFNPIELIWGDLKKNIRKYNNHPESSSAVVNLIRDQVDLITPEKWRNCIRHVIKVESSFLNTQPNEIIINLNDSDSSESDFDLC